MEKLRQMRVTSTSWNDDNDDDDRLAALTEQALLLVFFSLIHSRFIPHSLVFRGVWYT